MRRRPKLQPSVVPRCGRLGASRLLARLMMASLVIVLGGAFITPWTQNVRGMGRVIAYSPSARETPIKAPVSGQVLEWKVAEGEYVEKGQLLVQLADNDALILERLGLARDAVRSKSDALESAVSIAEEQVVALESARDAALDMAEQRVSIAQAEREAKAQEVIAARARLQTAELNLERQQQLNSQQLSSDRELELAILSVETATSALAAKQAGRRGAVNKTKAAFAELEEKRGTKQASIEKAGGDLQKLRAELGDAEAKAVGAEVKLSRQEQMRILAPRSGTILSITAREGSDYVKPGETLAVLVPDVADRAVELFVDGNDAPLIRPGRNVRLQFEGWPAVQFIGWPSVAVGTFGGEVAFVDRAARSDGTFRVVVRPSADDEPWPDPEYLRQGVRVKGWVLLNRVSVAYEVWRQLNGFPAAVPGPDSKEKAKR